MVNQQSMLDKNKRYSLRLPSDNVSENEHFKLCRFSWTSVRFLLLEFKWKGFLARLNSKFFLKFIHEKMGFSRNSPYLLKISISETVFTWNSIKAFSTPWNFSIFFFFSSHGISSKFLPSPGIFSGFSTSTPRNSVVSTKRRYGIFSWKSLIFNSQLSGLI